MRKKSIIRCSLSSIIFISLILGICTGLFFGELVGFFHVVGDVYIKLLQITVLPYVVLSLITGLGRLEYRQAMMLAGTGGVMLLLIWTITLVVVFLFPLALPDWQSSSFFSISLVQPKVPVDFTELYIPSNPFHSLASNMVPAVVLFCVLLGVALIGVQKKNALMADLSILLDALTRVTNFIVCLTPIGIFAITASVTGTIGISEFKQIEVYIFIYVIFTLVMSLWILPGLVAALTPLRYGQIMGLTKEALVTAFATSSVFIVLPVLAARSKELLASQNSGKAKIAESAVDVIIPASFSFPGAGKLFTFSFVLFAGWFSGFTVDPSEYPLLLGTGLMSLFAKSIIAVPFMLDVMHIPSDTFQLFIATSVINSHFGTLLAAMHVLSFTLLTAFAISGQIRIRIFGLLRYIFISCCLLFIVVTGAHLILTSCLKDSYNNDEILASMQDCRKEIKFKVYKEPPGSRPLLPTINRLQQIKETGILRICYNQKDIPFSYFNTEGQLVGFDIELLQILSADIGVQLELVPAPVNDLSSYFSDGYCDMGTGKKMDPELSMTQDYTKIYRDYTMALLVKDHKRHEFNDLEFLKSQELEIAIQADGYYKKMVLKLLPRAKLVKVDSHLSYIKGGNKRTVAMVTSAEKGSAWSLLYPEYAVATPFDNSVQAPVAFTIPEGEETLADFLNVWIDLKLKDGTITSLYNYWILGQRDKKKVQRWSIIRNVLHWVE